MKITIKKTNKKVETIDDCIGIKDFETHSDMYEISKDGISHFIKKAL